MAQDPADDQPDDELLARAERIAAAVVEEEPDTTGGGIEPDRRQALLSKAKREESIRQRGERIAGSIDLPKEPSGLRKIVLGTKQSVATSAKLPEMAGKLAEYIGLPKGTIERHVPAVKAVADFGRRLEQELREEEPFPAQDVVSQLQRGLGTMIPTAIMAPLGGAAARLARLGARAGETIGVLASTAGQTAIPMYEDVLSATGSEDKAWAAAALGAVADASELVGLGEILGTLNRASRGAIRQSLMRVAVKEAGQEEFQQLVQSVGSKVLTDEQIDFLEETVNSGKAGLIGLMLGGGVTGAFSVRLPGQPRFVQGSEGELIEEDVASLRRAGAAGLPAKKATGAAEEPAAKAVPEAAAPEAPTRTPQEAAQAILAGEDLELEELAQMPEAVAEAARQRFGGEPPTPTPGAPEPAPGVEAAPERAPAPTTPEAVQEPARTAEAPGVSSAAEERVRELARELRVPRAEVGRALERIVISRDREATLRDIEQDWRRTVGTIRAIKREGEERALAGIVAPTVKEEADRDALTGALRRPADARLHARIVKKATETGERVIRFFADFDNFKAVNTAFGLAGGDRALQVASQGIKNVAREGEAELTRWGGDEFTATIRVPQGVDVDAIRERLETAAKRALDEAGLGRAGDKEIGLSVGWVEAQPGEDIEALTKRAEEEGKLRKKARGVSVKREEAPSAPAVPVAVEKPEAAPSPAPPEEPAAPASKRGPPLTKAQEEDLELANVRKARAAVERGGTEHTVFDELLDLYESQPKLQARTSTSKQRQAYSTPLPLAWVASRLARAHEGTVYEPTAGNGALLIGTRPENARANELDEDRAKNLRALGFTPSIADATAHSPGSVDVVLANPPFGKLKTDAGEALSWQTTFGYRTKEIDHAIASKALEAMKDDGRAVLILGGQKPFGDQSQEARTKKYRALTQQAFWKGLYANYNVVDHFTVAGKLYDRQGAAWPIDVVVIQGRRPTPPEKTRPFAEAPRVLETWDEVRALLPGESVEPVEGEPVPGGRERPAEAAEGRPSPPEGLRAPAGRAPPEERPARGVAGGERPAGRLPTEGVQRAGAAPGGPAERVGRVAPESGPVSVERGVEGGGARELAEARAARIGPGREESAQERGRSEALADARVAGEARGLEKVNEFQSSYRPKSKKTPIGTLVPANMQAAMDRALEDIAQETGGDIDAFVAQKLGYSDKQMSDFFAAEQVDALALAIHNIDARKGFIIGDQTGVGKGRFVAALLRYAQRIGKIPVFVTAKPDLYADMKRDLTDIGMPDYAPFVTNTNLRGDSALALPDGSKIESLPGLKHAQTMQAIREQGARGELPEGVDAIFTTYDQMNPQKGERTARNAFLSDLAPNALVVLDESHLAGGTARGGFMRGKEGEAIERATRSEFFRDLVDRAHAVAYSSATYAKNPHVMSLYTRTDMGDAVENRSKLPELVEKGGVPLQQVIASMLVENGQYARREKSFEGIPFELDVAETPREAADTATDLLRSIFEFDLEMKEVREEYAKAAGARGGGVGGSDTATGSGGAKTAGFSSVMHNLVSQMLLALKARETGRRAVAMFRSGRKPVIALSNTMERILEDTAKESNSKPGDELPDFTFSKAFDRYLERTREVVIRLSLTESERHRLTDEEMGPMLAPFEALKAKIADADLADIPASPIDAIISEMEQAGMRVGEITGRDQIAKYDPDGTATLQERDNSPAARQRTRTDFNNGSIDALIINQSGAQGISLHASPKNGRDVRPRHMFVVQGDPNIDTFMQMLGRINRTGQTELPSFTLLVSDLPSEKRPAAVLMRKLASLNANTTASRKSAVSIENVVDFMNVYGDETMAEILRGEHDVASALGFDEERIARELEGENLARKATGYMPLLPISEQERLYDQIETNYTARLDEAKAQGENLLEAEIQDLKAKTIGSSILVEGEGTSPFTRSARLEEVEATRLTKPLAWEALQARARRLLGIDEGDVVQAGRERAQKMRSDIDSAVQEQRVKDQAAYQEAKKRVPEGASEDHPSRAKLKNIEKRFAKTQLNGEAIKERASLLSNRSIEIETESGAQRAWVVGIETPKGKANMLAPSSWAVVVAPVNGDTTIRLPISRLMASAPGQPGYILLRQTRETIRPEDFQGEAQQRREKRFIVTGNLLSGFEKFRGQGQIAFYTTDTGELRHGILLKRGINPNKVLEQQPVALTPEQALDFLEEVGGHVANPEGTFKITSRGRGMPFSLVAQTKGGKPFYLHSGVRAALGGDFTSRRGKKEWEFSTEDRAAVLRALTIYTRDLGLTLQTNQDRETARKITGEKLPEPEAMPASDAREGETELMAFPGEIGTDIKNALDAVAKKLGYVRNQKVLESGIIPTETWTERQIRTWQDSFRGIKAAQEAVSAEGGEIRDDTDAYLQEELRRGRTKDRLERYDRAHIAPLLTHLRRSGISPEEFGEALMARHAPERNAIIFERDPSNDAGSGLTDDEAAEIMARVQSGKRAAAFERGFSMFDAAISETRAGWVRDGLKSQEEVDELEERYQFYAPLRSDLSDDADAGPYRGTGMGIDVRGKEFKTALGRRTKAEAKEVLAYAFTQAQQAIVRGEKNRVAQSFLNWLRANEELIEGFAKISPRQIKRALVDGMVKTVYDPLFRATDNVILVHEDGNHVWIEIDPKYQNVADGLKNLGATDINKLVRFAGGITRWLAAVNTRYNPVFPLFNAVRDAAGAFINSSEHGLAFAVRTVRDAPLAFAALARRGGTGKWARLAEEYRRVGAPIAFLDLNSFEDQLRRIEKDTRARMKVGTIGQLHRGWRSILHAIETVTDIGENSVRFSAYVHAREDLGMSAERAASWSKNLTTNFERKGDAGATVNALYMFANAGIQSTARVGQAIRQPGVRRLLIAASMGLIAWDQLMRMLGGEDADGEDHWDKVPSWEKRHNFVLMYPDGSGRRITIPAPFVYDLVQTMAFQLSGTMSGDIKPGQAIGETLSAALEAFDPIGSGQIDVSDPASIVRTASPTLLDPLVELAINRDWKGDPIMPDAYGGTTPDSERFWPDASQTSRAITSWLNRVTGGDELKGGKIDISPETLDHWASFFTGGLGRTIAQMYELPRKVALGQVGPRDIPAVNRLLREPSPFASTSEFHRLQDAIRIEWDRAKRDKKLVPGDLASLRKEGNMLEEARQRRRKAIEKLTGDAKKAAEKALDEDLQRWNARARRVLLVE